MNLDKESVEHVNILCNRLNCLLKCISNAKLNIIEEKILQNLAKELAYNISVETINVFNNQ